MDKTHCPACNITWEGDEIPDGLMKSGNYATQEDAEKAAEAYGWSPDNRRRFSANMVGIQYPLTHPAHYDGVSEWNCTACGARFNRFTGQRLKEGEYAN